LLNHLGEPFADSSLVPTALVSACTRRHVTVALSGDGGDELFGGYWRYLGHHYLDRYHRLPAVFRRSIIEPLVALAPSARTTRGLDRIRQMRKLLAARNAPDAMARHLAWSRILDPADAAALLGPESAARAARLIEIMYRHNTLFRTDNVSAPASSSRILNSILLTDLAVGLPGDMLFKVDTASMFHSLEVRVPLLAQDLVAFVANLPVEYKLRGALGKRILRDAFRDDLPPEVLARRKMGFEVPVGEFLRSELRGPYHDIVTDAALHDLGLHPPTAARLYNEHLSRRRDRTELLWALFVLCWWKGNSPQRGTENNTE
jgi:asparagine synthase (glutamine-hydrolysing)